MKPFFQSESVTLYNGDCREVIKELPGNCIDSIVCDPPYELGFMGKGWDRSGIAYDVNVWRECLRVLKPGGHLLAFGGSRTYHRLACAIEDAGFEIRDQIQYIYGSGFPKSLNVSKNLRDEGSVCICNERNGDLLSVQNGISDLESVVETGDDADLFAPVQRSATRAGMGHARLQRIKGQNAGELPERSDAWPKESSVERRRDLFPAARELCAHQVREMSSGIPSDGSQGRVCDGAPLDHGAMDRQTVDENGSRASRRSQSSEQPAHEPAFMARQSQPQTSGAWSLCGRCGKPMVSEGIGSALKPAHEPIVVARKPFTSTLIQNVLQHGTGGLNIDGCRISTDEVLSAGSRRLGDGVKFGFCEPKTEYEQNQNGRWPANVILDGSEEVLAGFPETTSGDGLRRPNGSERVNTYQAGWKPHPYEREGDSGSAARFFYTAKADKRDREEGLNDLPILTPGELTNRRDGSKGLESPRAGAGRANSGGRRNHHPTVKPLSLMRYLVRLVTPPNGLVLDPFCGSGSTGKACAVEGFRAILIDINADYCELTARRCSIPVQPSMFQPGTSVPGNY